MAQYFFRKSFRKFKKKKAVEPVSGTVSVQKAASLLKSDSVVDVFLEFWYIFPEKLFSYSVSLRIQSEYEKMRTRITPNTDTF